MNIIKKAQLQTAIAGLAMIESRYKSTGVIDKDAHRKQMLKIFRIIDDSVWGQMYFHNYIFEKFPHDFPYTCHEMTEIEKMTKEMFPES